MEVAKRMMKWFTAQAANDLAEEVWDAACSSYTAHIDRLRKVAEPPVSQFAQEVNLHDGIVTELRDGDPDELSLIILIGDLQVGYEYIDIHFNDPEFTFLDQPNAELLQAHEILYEEVDLVGQRYELRLALDTWQEVAVRFGSLSWSRRPADPGDRRRLMERRKKE